jgi:GNAT superfamily N-acetyltransferase
MAIRIRPTETADAAAIAELLTQLGYPATADDVVARLQYWFADERSRVIAAEIDGDLVGVAAVHAVPLLEHTGSRGRLVALVVDEASRRQGVARALVAAAEREAAELGCLEMEITSARDRYAAHDLYSRLGYEDACTRAARFVRPLAVAAPGRGALG